MLKNKILILTGPSGAGKTTIADYIINTYNFTKCKTYTTRPKRENESDADYVFLTQAEFEQKIERDEMLEYVQNFGFYYGSARNSFEIENNIVVVLDSRGASTLKELYPNRATIIRMDINRDTMLTRVAVRSLLDKSQIFMRLLDLEKEKQEKKVYDYIVNSNEALVKVQQNIGQILNQMSR